MGIRRGRGKKPGVIQVILGKTALRGCHIGKTHIGVYAKTTEGA